MSTATSRTDKILVVDDDADIRSLLGTLFERAGLRVVKAETGQAGMRALFEHRPDLVVVDLPGHVDATADLVLSQIGRAHV